MKTRHYENEICNCFRVVPGNIFLALYSFMAIIKLALSSFYADTELLVSFHLWRYNPFWTLVSLRKHLHFSLSSARLHHPCVPKICDVTLWTTPSIPVCVFPIGVQLWRTYCKATVYFSRRIFFINQDNIPLNDECILYEILP
jgi:hypothetical protein